MAKWIVAEKTKAGLRHAVVCSNVTGRTKKRVAQSKCWFARPCWLATSGANLYPPGVWFVDVMAFFLWCYVCFVLLRFSSLCFRWSRGPSFNRTSICRRSDSHTCYFFLSFFPFFLFIWRCRFFGVFFFVPSPLSLCMESTSYVLFFRTVFFLPCDHGLDFLHQLMWEFNQPNNQIMSGRSPPLHRTLTLIAMQGHETKIKNKTGTV